MNRLGWSLDCSLGSPSLGSVFCSTSYLTLTVCLPLVCRVGPFCCLVVNEEVGTPKNKIRHVHKSSNKKEGENKTIHERFENLFITLLIAIFKEIEEKFHTCGSSMLSTLYQCWVIREGLLIVLPKSCFIRVTFHDTRLG